MIRTAIILQRFRHALRPTQSVESRFLGGVFWAISGTLVAQGLGMLCGIFTARVLGEVGFGEYGIVNSTLGTLGVFAGLGLGLTATKHIAQYRISDPAKAGRVLGLTIDIAVLSAGIVTSVLFVLAPLIAAKMLNAPQLSAELRIGCLLLFVNVLNGTQIAALAGLEAFRASTMVSFLRGLLNFPLVIAGAVWLGVRGAVEATVLVGAASVLLNALALARECSKNRISVSYGGGWAELPIFWQFSVPAFLSNVATAMTLWAADAILANRRGGYAELGLFNAADQWRTVLMFLPSSFVQVALPLMAKELGKDHGGGGYGTSVLMTQGLSVLAVIPAGTALMFLSDWIIGLYGQSFSAGGLVVIGVVAGVMIQSVTVATGPAIQAAGRMWLGFAVNAIWGLALIAFAWYMVPAWGAVAIGFAFVVSYLMLALVSYLYLAPVLPNGMARRAALAIGYILLLTAGCVLLPTRPRVVLAIPSVLMSAFVTLFIFVDGRLRRSSLNRLRSALNAAG